MFDPKTLARHIAANLVAILIAALVVASIGLALVGKVSEADAAAVDTSRHVSAMMTRTCIFAAGAAETVDCSDVASAASSALNPWARYYITCTEDSWIRWGTTSPTAADGDMILPADTWIPLLTSADLLYFAVRNVTTDGKCYALECR